MISILEWTENINTVLETQGGWTWKGMPMSGTTIIPLKGNNYKNSPQIPRGYFYA